MAAASGIAPTNETLDVVEQIRKSKFFFATFKVDGTTIVPDVQFIDQDLKAKGDQAVANEFKTKVWPELVKSLTAAAAPRFVVVDFTYNTADGRIQKSLLSLGWCPDNKTPARQKMTFASSKTAFETKISVGKKYQANDEADLEYTTVMEYMLKL